ncbi:hypothetical protein [Chromobacterium violaceum]|uniref:Uncharacterized protein n=2 Tax=Chromobacterium violaceum TaxID=536 RepID=Q7NRK2_CHRVO|nr:hypothetical protein [Chromobacterium violaceum]AAQ61441.1 hypothetical protein CV_3779 [Chromobacterium violaceum ATCC 12472]MBA8734680.1 hypothetical protein [Chromobacterium violaceum]MBP4043572.1 hypothetical protein [Chromobacterium violaceum]MBP4051708.1 hypothetical protein [Chromobacterium violaceum]MBT2868468.1 hypothetical protein [Chromobacterium violaceum]
MAFPTAVNDQITDAVAQGNLKTPGAESAPDRDGLPPDPAELEELIRQLKTE